MTINYAWIGWYVLWGRREMAVPMQKRFVSVIQICGCHVERIQILCKPRNTLIAKLCLGISVWNHYDESHLRKKETVSTFNCIPSGELCAFVWPNFGGFSGLFPHEIPSSNMSTHSKQWEWGIMKCTDRKTFTGPSERSISRSYHC